MKQEDVSVGGTYVARVSGRLVKVRVDGVKPAGWDRRRRYFATNLATGRQVVKSAAALRPCAPSCRFPLSEEQKAELRDLGPRRLFVDKHGAAVSVGDRVRGLFPSVNCGGVVVRLSDDRTKKPFAVDAGSGRTIFMAEEWTERVGPTFCPSCFNEADPETREEPAEGSEQFTCPRHAGAVSDDVRA